MGVPPFTVIETDVADGETNCGLRACTALDAVRFGINNDAVPVVVGPLVAGVAATPGPGALPPPPPHAVTRTRHRVPATRAPMRFMDGAVLRTVEVRRRISQGARRAQRWARLAAELTSRIGVYERGRRS